MRKLSPLGDLIDIREQIERDQEIDRSELRQRDRAIGLAHTAPSGATKSKLARLRQWINALRASGQTERPGHKVDAGMRTIIFLCWALGAVAGYFITSSVLAYDGSQPVNLLIALLVLIGVQILALITLCLLLLFRRRNLLETLSILNPANFITLLIGRLQPAWKEAIEAFSSRVRGSAKLGLLPQMMTYLAQHFSIAFNIGALAALFYLVTVSDLAFGWNTTLDIQSQTVSKFLQNLAIPWQSLLPAAVPDDNLVEASRFYRLQTQLRSSEWEPRELGTWWLYLAMCIAVYGFLPRLIALIISGIQYDRCIARATLSLAGSSQILARMSDPLVSADAPQAETPLQTSLTRPGLPGRQAAREIQCLIIEWSDCAPDDGALSKVRVTPVSRLQAGGRQSLSEDKETVVEAARIECEGIAIAIKSWEPPMLEFTDFVSHLRQSVADSLPIIVLLQPLPDQSVNPTQLETWETALGTTADAALYLESL